MLTMNSLQPYHNAIPTQTGHADHEQFTAYHNAIPTQTGHADHEQFSCEVSSNTICRWSAFISEVNDNACNLLEMRVTE